MDDWWNDVERDILDCLQGRGATPVEEVARRLAVSETAAASLLALLAREGKVRIRSVEAPPRDGTDPAAT
jgi:DNA-binding Lrp family transcriptional regulator